MYRFEHAKAGLTRLVVLFLGAISSWFARRQDLYVVWDPERRMMDDAEFARRFAYYMGGGRAVRVIWVSKDGTEVSTLENERWSERRPAGVSAKLSGLLQGRILFAHATRRALLMQRLFWDKCFVVDWKTEGYRDSVWRWLAASNVIRWEAIQERWKSFPTHGDEVVVMGTGPSAGLIFEEPYRSLPVIACNTSLKSDRLRKHKVAAFCIADALYFLAPTDYGKRFQEMLRVALREQDFPVLINAEHYDFFRRRMPFIRDELIFPVVMYGHFRLSADFRKAPITGGACSVFPQLMLPLAIGEYQKIQLIGFDGKDPSMKNYFWKHSDEFQYQEELPTVKEHDPGSFGARAADFYDRYNEVYAGEIEGLLKVARERGREVHMAHPSFVPPLKRLHEEEHGKREAVEKVAAA